MDNESKEEKSELSILKEKFQQNKENREKEILTADTANEVRLTYMHTYVHAYIHTYILTYIHTHTYTLTPIHTHIHTHTHTHKHTHTHTQAYTYMYTLLPCKPNNAMFPCIPNK